MGDWIGALFLLVLGLGALWGLRQLARPSKRSAEEFERSAAEGTTMLGAGVNALQELMNPEAAKAKEVQTQLKEGRYLKKKREGKAGGNTDETGS